MYFFKTLLIFIGFILFCAVQGIVSATVRDVDFLKQCRYADALQNEYKDFYKITNLKGARPNGYIVHFPFFVKAQRDVHVLLTTGPRAIRADNEYEIVIGGWGGSQTVIRRQQQSQQPLASVQHSEIISRQKWAEYLLQITTEGNIRLLRKESNDSYKVIVEANDPDPLPVEYVSFGSWDNNHVEFYFDCLFSVDTPEDVFKKTPVIKLTETDKFKKQCRYADALHNEYNDFYKITNINGVRPNGYIVHFPFFVRAQRDANVLFTTGPSSIRADNEYEIVIGGWGGSQTVIRRQQQSQQPLASVQHSEIISRQKWAEYLLQITTEGNIKLLRKESNDSYKVILEANDPDPLPVEYISFGSWDNNHVEFYFDCSFIVDTPEDVFKKTPVIKLTETDKFKKQCRYADALHNEYNDFYKITNISGVRPNGYIVHFPFFVRAQRDANVLFTTGPSSIRADNEYEIVIGGWGGSQTVIRRQQQSQQPLASVQHSEIISRQKWAEYLLQITTEGNIRLLRKESNDSYKVIVEANDPDPLPVEYISFGSWDNNHVEFYFNCSFSVDTPEDVFKKTPVIKLTETDKFKKQCRYADALHNEYNDFYKIANISGVRPNGYIVHFPFFVRAQRDANVLFTTGPSSIRADNEYEIVIGGWGGSQTVIRRQQQSQQPLASVQHSEIISRQKWAEYLLQITTEGNIRLLRKGSNDSYKVIVEANDPDPLPVEYISFSSWDNNHVEFYFNCSFSVDTPEDVFKKTPVINLTETDKFKKQCRYADALHNEYNDFYKIANISGVRPNGYIVHFPFFVRAQRDANVLFTTGPSSIRADNEYEIVIGGWGGSQTVIRRQQQSQQPLASVQHSEIISRQKWAEYLLQITTEGNIRLLRKESNDSYKVIVEANDPDPLPVEYISFGSWDNNHVEFYFNCSFIVDTPEDVFKKTPVINLTETDKFKKQCRYADALHNEYNDFYKIANISGVRPNGYIVHFPFFVRAQRDANVLFTTGPSSIRADNEYEIVIGGWGGSQTVIRRQQQSEQPLASVQHSEIISRQKWAEYLLQITTEGNIKLLRKESNDSYKVIVEANDPDPLPVEYISFGSWDNNHVEFYFNCSFSVDTPEDVFKKTPVIKLNETDKFKKQCRYADALHNEYNDFYKIANISGVRPNGYIVHFPFFVRAQRDANVLFTTGPSSIRADNEYEIVIGGWGGSQTVIRRQQQSQQPLASVQHSEIISRQKWAEYLLQITTEGNIRLLRKESNDSYKVIVEANDPDPLPVEYISFGSWDNNHVEFYFNCSFIVDTPEDVFKKTPVINLTETDKFKKQCRYADALHNEYNDFYKIANISGVRPNGYIVHFPFFVRAQRDANVLFTTGPSSIRADNEYEIVIGGWGGSQTVIRRQQQSQQPLASVQHSEIISRQKWAEYLLQITTEGNIRLLRKESNDSYKVIVEANDPDPLPVEYISFGSWDNNHVEFYFNCSFSVDTPEDVFKKTPVIKLTETDKFKKQCRYADALHNEYNDFYKIANISGVRPNGYIVHFPFFVRAQRDANVLFTTGPSSIRADNEYEIVIGGWGGSQTVIRRQQQSQQPLASVQHSEIISRQKWAEYLLQITTEGNIRLLRKESNDSYKVIVEANDPDPLPVEYISFGSWDNNHVEFYFNCSFSVDTPEDVFKKTPVIKLNETDKFKKQCRYADALHNEYNDFYKIANISGVRPNGYIVHFPFFVRAQRDVHVLLTNGSQAIREANEYEIVIGGCGGTQTVIRRQQQSQQPLASAQHSEIISKQEWAEYLLQITTEGNIKLLRKEGNDSYKVIVEANDPDPLTVEYISFGSWENSHVEVYFDCSFSVDTPEFVFNKKPPAVKLDRNDQLNALQAKIENVDYLRRLV